MNAKFIYNTTCKVYTGTLAKMADKAINEGYCFFLFNDNIYYTDEKKNISKTNLTLSDIFQYL